MDRRPIGVFDSGLGGLTAVRALWQILPEEHLIYFGDTARVPYGGRSQETLLKYARQDVRFLRSFDLKAILVACGTVTTTALPTLQKENDLPIVGVVEPACRRAAACLLYTSSGGVCPQAVRVSREQTARKKHIQRRMTMILSVENGCNSVYHLFRRKNQQNGDKTRRKRDALQGASRGYLSLAAGAEQKCRRGAEHHQMCIRDRLMR